VFVQSIITLLSLFSAATVRPAHRVIFGVDLIEVNCRLPPNRAAPTRYKAADPHLVQRVKDLTGGGIDFASEVTGAKSAFKTTHKGGEIIGIEFGSYKGQCPYASQVGHAKAIRGSVVGSAVAERDIPRYLQYSLEGMLVFGHLASGFRGVEVLEVKFNALERERFCVRPASNSETVEAAESTEKLG
jgi:Zn-dependent alcohol dehydrogenase